ncbi:hypothetical protein BDQ12DRAFT_723890 [Crucibulum laeve]|uniref:Tr-type G domain-containing protein n=1 Tax=Crucibulum laeve TaxID=68775 RepID=A0A5C3LX43_9AGAR|nr:hypothetical protein BDQ12DRAFT_723890 [Crucibulum laeve]
MSMVDGVALVVDTMEGPMMQMRFVLSRALTCGLKPLVVLNKADRPTARPVQAESDLFDLFQVWARDALPEVTTPHGMTPLFDRIFKHVSVPAHLNRTSPFSMLAVQVHMETDPYVSALYLGRIQSGVVKVGDTLWAIDEDRNKVHNDISQWATIARDFSSTIRKSLGLFSLSCHQFPTS